MSKKFNHYELPRSKRSMLYRSDETRVTEEYEVFADRRGSNHMVELLEGEGYWDWIEDDCEGMIYGKYKGPEDELEGALAEVDLETYQGNNATRVLIPKDNL